MSDLRVGDEPRWITEAILLAIHARQIERYGGAHGVRDKGVVLSSLARPINRRAYDSEADFADLGASCLVGFARSQGFTDGNKRTALACALVFLAINGFVLHVPPVELYELTMSAALGKGDDASVARYLRDHLLPSRPTRS
ncbi:MAG TPA: type II toxin-antitoxin system death-on-curing family toxin [Gemmatimonadaceae bacterium]|nr:type II toxin-antitoxin system death-on-curing family toxin [Gemmatimonadaceae bacterium]